MDTRNILSRRTTIKSALAIAAAAVVPAASLAAIASDERLHQLMTEWRAEYDAVSAMADATSKIHMDRLYLIEGEAAAIRPTTLAGLAIKLLILTNYGEHDLDGHASGILVEAESISGYGPPAAFKREA